MSLLQDKVIIISGVGPGLGRAMALEFASEGAIVLCVARNADLIEEVAGEVREAGGQAEAVAGDITIARDCARVAEVTSARFGRLDGLVNSAFTAGCIAPFVEVDLNDWRQTFEVNVFGTLSMIKATLPLLRKDGGGVVVNINTTSAIGPMKNQGGYGGSKAALEFLTRQLAVELGPARVRFNTVYCGPMIGPNLNAAMDNWAQRRAVSLPEIRDLVASRIALGYIPEDEQAARAIALLLSDQAAVVTGTAMHATGGIWLEHQF